VRSTRKVELTAAGRSSLDHAQAMLASVETAVDEARRVATGHAGRVVLGFTVSATYEVMPKLIQALRVDVPEIELDLRGEMLTPVLVAALLDHSLDIGFLRPPVRIREINVRIPRRSH
jgi:DNA-binding transcriptional LysR family regulator